jgi:hypothetical protein
MAIDPRTQGKLRSGRDDHRPTEDDIAKAKLGPRGVPGAPDAVRETPEMTKNTPPAHAPKFVANCCQIATSLGFRG